MRIFIGERVFDCRDGMIGIIVNDQDKKNIAAMHPDCVIYSEFIPTGKTTWPGAREFSVEEATKMLDRLRALYDSGALDGKGEK